MTASLTTSAKPAAGPATFPVPHGLVAAVAWCHLGSSRTPTPWPDNEDFLEAETLGLLRRYPTWHATPQGVGMLIATGLLAGSPAPDVATVHVLWCAKKHGVPQLVAAFPCDLVEFLPSLYERKREDAEREYRKSHDPEDRPALRFFTTVTTLEHPTVPEAVTEEP